MFQVEPVLWLQSLESPALTWVMTMITTLGYTPVYGSILIVLLFGVRLKQSLFIFLAIVICGLMTDGLKRGLMFPRPSDVDVRVIEPGHERPPLLVDGGGAKGFWDFPSSEAMAAAKRQTDWSYGLPSGHVALAATFFLALAFFFRSRGTLVFAICWIILMALSRMYLGRHFIGDVMGGVGVGLIAVAITAFLVRPLNTQDDVQESDARRLLRWAVFVIPLVVLAPFVDLLDKEDVGRMLALFVTYALLLRIGLPSDKAIFWKRAARVLIAITAFVVIERIVDPIMDLTGLEDSAFGSMMAVFVITAVSLSGTILLARRLKLFGDTSPG